MKGLTLYLKVASVLLQQSLAEYRVDDVTLIGPRISRTRKGLPRVIPASHRYIIVNRRPGCYLLMRYYLSIFYMYRVLTFPGKLKLESISSPGKYFNFERFEIHIDRFIDLFFKRKAGNPLEAIKKRFKIFPIFRSSPSTSAITYDPFKVHKKSRKMKGSQLWSTHVISLLESTRNLMANPLFDIYVDILLLFGKANKLREFLAYQRGAKVLSDGQMTGPLIE